MQNKVVKIQAQTVLLEISNYSIVLIEIPFHTDAYIIQRINYIAKKH